MELLLDQPGGTMSASILSFPKSAAKHELEALLLTQLTEVLEMQINLKQAEAKLITELARLRAARIAGGG